MYMVLECTILVFGNWLCISSLFSPDDVYVSAVSLLVVEVPTALAQEPGRENSQVFVCFTEELRHSRGGQGR